MRHRRYSLICPDCGHVQVVVRDSLLIAGMNPAIEQKMDEESYFKVRCRLCGYEMELESELSYQSPSQKYMLFLHMDHMQRQSGFYCLSVSSAVSFYLARRILKAGLLPEDVLPKIAALKKQGADQVRFLEYDRKNGLLWFENDGVNIAVKM